MSNDGLIFNINSILGSTIASNGSVVHQIGTLKTATGKEGQPGDTYDNQAQVWTICGISSVPVLPSGTQNCAQSISISRSDQDIIFATRDTRSQPTDITYGEIYLYNGDLSSVIQIKANGVVNVNANTQVNITAPMTQIGDSSAQPVTPAPWSQELLLLLTTFFTAMEGDPLLPLLLPSTYSAVQTLVAQLPILLDVSVAPNPVPGATQKMKAT